MAELRFHVEGTRAAALKHSLANGRTDAHAEARDERNAKIVAMRQQGVTVTAIGRQFRLTRQQVHVILAGHAKETGGGKIHGDDADMWLRDHDPAYASADRDLRRGVKRLPEDLRRTA